MHHHWDVYLAIAFAILWQMNIMLCGINYSYAHCVFLVCTYTTDRHTAPYAWKHHTKHTHTSSALCSFPLRAVVFGNVEIDLNPILDCGCSVNKVRRANLLVYSNTTFFLIVYFFECFSTPSLPKQHACIASHFPRRAKSFCSYFVNLIMWTTVL